MAQFPNTQWSLIRRSAESGDGGRAFGELTRLYRSAILAFFRAQLDAAAAEDATQSFLALSFEREWWSRADSQLGSFRSFLLMLLRRHLGHVRRGLSPLDDHADAVDDAIDNEPGADRQFDNRFALLLTANAMATQRERYRERDRGALFERLLPLLSSPPEHGELKTVAEALQMPPNTLTIELQRMRQRLRESMRAELKSLCADEKTFAEEWALLVSILEGG